MANSDYQFYAVLAGDEIVANSGASKLIGDVGSFSPISGSGTLNVSG